MKTKVLFHRCSALTWLALVIALPVSATTLMRAGLDELVATNAEIIVGEVVDVSSYWNAEGTFILTDVTLTTDQWVKGTSGAHQVTVTLMGGTVGETTTLIVGGAELRLGEPYLLFLNEENLPGAPNALTVRDHVQGAFEIVSKAGTWFAVSQAAGHPLVPDRSGTDVAPGGSKGFPLASLVEAVQEIDQRNQWTVKP